MRLYHLHKTPYSRWIVGVTRVRGCAEEMLVPSPLLRALCVAVVSELQVRVNMGSFIRMASEKARRSFRWRLSADFAALSSGVHKGGVSKDWSGLCQVFGKGNKPQRHATWKSNTNWKSNTDARRESSSARLDC